MALAFCPPSIDLKEERTMLTVEENEMLSKVGAGTPAGELLRGFALPAGTALDGF